jgi:hypothetical protein
LDFDIINPIEMDNQLYDYNSNEYKIIEYEIDSTLKEIIALNDKMIKKYYKKSKIGIITDNDLLNNHCMSLFFPENDQLNIPCLKEYIHELFKISNKAENAFFRIIVYSASEFENRIYLEKKNGISDFLAFSKFRKKFKENEKIFGIPKYGKFYDRHSSNNYNLLKNTVMVVDNTHERSIGQQLGLKLKDKIEIPMGDTKENILCEIYIIDA